MLLSFGEYTVELGRWEGWHEMSRYVAECELGNVVLGEDAEYYSDYHSATVRPGLNGLRCFGIGLVSEGHGLEPHLLLRPSTGELIFGLNRQAVWVSVEERRIVSRIQLNSPFRAFLPIERHNTLLILHEVGVLALYERDQEAWRYDGDIVSNYWVEGEKLHLEFMDAPQTSLDLRTGPPSDRA